MNLQHLNVKIMIADPQTLDFEEFIPIFHRWIQQKVTEERILDVADYLHVPEGPGVMLIGHEANFSIDHTEGRWGFLYNRKTAMEGENADKIRGVLKAALAHAQRLEKEPALKAKLAFNAGEMQVLVNDRLLAPNTEASLKALEPDLKATLGALYGKSSYHLKRHEDPRERLTLEVKAEKPLAVSDVIKNLG
ncbi:MAG: hypothetical protein U1F57_04125 [bacterium]